MQKTREEVAQEVGAEVIGSYFTPQRIEEYYRTTERFGLTWDTGWIWGEVWTESGQRYTLCRGYEKASTNQILVCKLTDDLGRTSEKLYKHLYMGPMYFEMSADGEKVLLKSYPSKNNMKIELGVGTYHWEEENGEIDLHFDRLGPAFRFLSPAAATGEEVYYTSEVCRIEGVVQGEKVKGFGALDQAWLPPGVGWTQCKTYKYLQDYWIVFTNRYADGTIDYGISLYGAGNWNYGYYVDNGKATLSMENNRFDMTWAEEGYPKKASLKMGPVNLEWTVKSRMYEIKGNVIWAAGQMINLDKKEKPVESTSWVEFRSFERSFDPRRTGKK